MLPGPIHFRYRIRMVDSLLPCPSCRTNLKVPDELRGKVITCLECNALLISSPLVDEAALSLAPPSAVRGGFPPRIFIAMAALIFLGIAGAFVNGYYAIQFHNDPEALERYADSTLAQMVSIQMFGAKQKDVDEKWDAETTRRRAKEWVAEHGERMKTMAYVFLAVSVVVVVGGLAFAFQKPYWLAWVGCVVAMANLNHGCCFPGVVAGIWGMSVLFSNEGRRYFGIDGPAASPSVRTLPK